MPWEREKWSLNGWVAAVSAEAKRRRHRRAAWAVGVAMVVVLAAVALLRG